MVIACRRNRNSWLAMSSPASGRGRALVLSRVPPGCDHVGQPLNLGQHAAELCDVVDFDGDVQCGNVFPAAHIDGWHVDAVGADDAGDLM